LGESECRLWLGREYCISATVSREVLFAAIVNANAQANGHYFFRVAKAYEYMLLINDVFHKWIS